MRESVDGGMTAPAVITVEGRGDRTRARLGVVRPGLLQVVRELPSEPGVYRFRDDEGAVLYVGRGYVCLRTVNGIEILDACRPLICGFGSKSLRKVSGCPAITLAPLFPYNRPGHRCRSSRRRTVLGAVEGSTSPQAELKVPVLCGPAESASSAIFRCLLGRVSLFVEREPVVVGQSRRTRLGAFSYRPNWDLPSMKPPNQTGAPVEHPWLCPPSVAPALRLAAR
jgi:hypothetical protein